MKQIRSRIVAMRFLGGPACLIICHSLAGAACSETASVPFEDSEHVSVETEDTPCNGAAGGSVADICVWASDQDLKRMFAEPGASIEVPAEMTLLGWRITNGEIEIHGGVSRRYPKKSYRYKFPKGALKYDFFGRGVKTYRRLVLNASWVDRSFIRTKLAYDLTHSAGGLAPHTGFVRLYLNGELQGLYVLTERIDSNFLKHNGLSGDGYLYKASSHHANWALNDNPLAGFELKNGTPGSAQDIAALWFAAQHAVADYESFEAEVAPLVSLQDFEIWHAVMAFAQNIDTFTKNYYLYRDPHEPDSQFRIIQWDADATFGSHWSGRRYEDTDGNIFGTRNNNAFSERYFKIPEYRRRYVQLVKELLSDALSYEKILQEVDRIATVIRDDAQRDLEQWDRGALFDSETTYLKDVIRHRYQAVSDAVFQEEIADGD